MRRLHAEDGVTLVELLVATAIMGIIIPAMTGAMVMGWRTTDDTIARLSDNRNREITPSLWTRDVQSTKTVDKNGAVTTCLIGGDALIARFTWAETPGTGPPAVTRVVAWVWSGSTTKLLERRFCATGASITSSVATAHDVSLVPVATCRDAAGGSVTGCGATTVVVELLVTDPSGSYRATGRKRST
jgi:prepilin-type N-terminal cleavage/methylation domain-containing protein